MYNARQSEDVLPTITWGSLVRGDAGDQRRTRGLGLGAAVRVFNDLAVPGLGGLWFAKPLLWSLLGLEIGAQTGKPAIRVANAIEALGCWHALKATGGERDPRIGGRTKLSKLLDLDKFPDYSQASRRDFYVTVPMRQGMVQPLRELGLVAPGVQRFNAYSLSEAGKTLLDAACVGVKPGNVELPTFLERWVQGAEKRVHLDSVGGHLSPLTLLPAPAAHLLRERLLSGQGGPRRRAVREWVRRLANATTPASWATRPAEVAEDHWFDLREGARFFRLRDAALRVLDGVEGALRPTEGLSLTETEAAAAVTAPVAELRARAAEFESAGRDPSGGLAAGFARRCLAKRDVDVVTALVELDGRGLRRVGAMVRPGPAFDRSRTDTVGANADGGEEAAGADATTGAKERLPLSPGTSYRVQNLFSLDADLDAAIAAGAP